MKKRDIILVSELFYPDQTSTAYIMTKIADRLCQNANLTAISGDRYYSGEKFQNEFPGKPYNLIRIKTGSWDKNKLFSRVIKMTMTSMKLFFKLMRIVKSDSEVVIVTNPAPFLLLASILKTIKKFNLNIIVQDVFPENAHAAGIISSEKFSYKLLLKLWENAYSKADRLIVCGRDMKSIFLGKLKKYKKIPEIVVIENWSDKNTHNTKNCNQGPVELLFAGNIGRCQGIEKLLDNIKEAEIENVIFNFRGDGAVVPFIEDFKKENPTLNVRYGGRFSRNEQFDIIDKCDIALVTLAEGMLGLGVPSKTYNIMAAGKPILYIGDKESEIAMVIKEHEIGYCFEPDEGKKLAEWLKSLDSSFRKDFIEKGTRAKKLAETIYSEEAILSKYSELFS